MLWLGLGLWVRAQSPEATELWEAARKGDAARVSQLLKKGVHVNTQFRYGATALAYACDRGHVEVVKVLLDHGADVNVKDTFYQASPIFWAASPASVENPTERHLQIVRLLLEKGAQGRDDVLVLGAGSGNKPLVELVLQQGGLKAESLSTALAAATREKHEEIAQMLRAAGAVPPPKADFRLDPETLARYAGTYRSETGELVLTVRDAKLFASPSGQPPLPLGAFDKLTFAPEGLDGVSIKFQVEGERIVGFTLKQGSRETTYKRVVSP